MTWVSVCADGDCVAVRRGLRQKQFNRRSCREEGHGFDMGIFGIFGMFFTAQYVHKPEE